MVGSASKGSGQSQWPAGNALSLQTCRNNGIQPYYPNIFSPPPPLYTLLDQQLASKGPFWSNFTLNGQQKREKQGADPPPKIPQKSQLIPPLPQLHRVCLIHGERANIEANLHFKYQNHGSQDVAMIEQLQQKKYHSIYTQKKLISLYGTNNFCFRIKTTNKSS